MDLVLAIVLAVVAIAIIGAIYVALRGVGSTPAGEVETEEAREQDAMGRPRPVVVDFHVKGEDALVYFGVPLPEGDVDEVLRDLLLHEAVEELRTRRGHGLPLEGIHRVRAYGQRNGGYAEAGRLDLPEPGELPSLSRPEVVSAEAAPDYDPLDRVGSGDFTAPTGAVGRAEDRTLASITEELRLTAATQAALRAQGVDPDEMTLEELVLSLLRMAGYTVTPGNDAKSIDGAGQADVYRATGRGTSTHLVIVTHQPGEYQELSERAVNQVLVGFGQAQADRGLLVTDKFGPYLIYEKEKRQPRCRFITRERLQAFVDSFVVA